MFFPSFLCFWLPADLWYVWLESGKVSHCHSLLKKMRCWAWLPSYTDKIQGFCKAYAHFLSFCHCKISLWANESLSHYLSPHIDWEEWRLGGFFHTNCECQRCKCNCYNNTCNFSLSKTLSLNSASAKQSAYYYSTIDTMCLTSGFAVLFWVKSFVGVWYFWHNLWWHYMRDAGHMTQVFRCILFVSQHFAMKMQWADE